MRAIKELADSVVLGPSGPATWLPSDPSMALLACIGAGPWKAARRVNVQMAAIRWYAMTGCSDLSEVADVPEKVYPLEWQNRILRRTVENLRSNGERFSDLCALWSHGYSWEVAIVDLFDICGARADGYKVLWMFARDHLGLPAFPVDRHIRRALVDVGLPIDSWAMTRACIDVGVDPSALNRGLFPAENPSLKDVS